MMKKLFLLLLSASVVMISACTYTASAPGVYDEQAGPETGTVPVETTGTDEPAVSAESSANNGVFIFPHLPVPVELEKIGSDTVVFTTTEFHGGLFTLKGRISQDSLMNFFLNRLPEEGWRLAGRLESQTCYMAFTNSSGGSCLIQISRETIGFSTEVRIYVSEGQIR